VGLSDSDLVFVCESAEDLFPADPVLSEVDFRRPGVSLSRRELAERAVWPGCVVVLQVLGPSGAVGVIDDQRPVEELPAEGADDLVADRDGSRRLRWAGENPDAFRLEYSVEGAGEPVGFQNLAAALDLGFYAARSYSLMRLPRTGRRLICSKERSATG
jgi:hypothetical protein